MAKKKENLKELKTADLEKRAKALSEEEKDIRFKAEGARPKNVKEIKNLKKDIARVLTELRARAQAEK